jgi:hypothetical protein
MKRACIGFFVNAGCVWLNIRIQNYGSAAFSALICLFFLVFINAELSEQNK